MGRQAKFEQKTDFAGKKKPAKKQKAKKVLVKQEERELGWGGFDDVAPPTRTTVVLRNVFAPTDFVEDATLRDDLETDMAGECGKLGALLGACPRHACPPVARHHATPKFTADSCVQPAAMQHRAMLLAKLELAARVNSVLAYGSSRCIALHR